jgi:2-polyprenyl-6-hydroxyphenyl methylase/3-demethylubiquinone-9 3-methyltransferase
MGCGGGILSESMARLGACVTGVDVVERNILVARHHAQQEGIDIDYHISNAETLINTGRTYDVVLNMEVVEHVSDLHTFMHACNQLVKPDGLMFIATINRTFMAWFSAILGAEYILRWLPRGTHQWRKFRKPQELEVLLNQDHLHVLHRTGVMVNPVSRQMHLSTMTSINYMLVALKRNSNSAQHPLPVRQ